MVFTRDDLRDQLKRREFAPVYLLFGPETQLRDIAAKTIATLSFSANDLRDFNETTFSLNSDESLQKAIAAAEQLPMMAAKRVVMITDVRVSATGFRDTLTEAHEPLLASYLANPSPQSIVIFVADELNGTRKMGKFLRDKTHAVEFKRLDDDQLAELARSKVRDAGAEIDGHSLRYLISQIGPDVHRLTNEINKLAAAALPEKTITIELIDELVPNTRELSNFDLTDHLVAGRRAKALAALKKILDDGAEPVALLGLIAYNYRRMLIAKELMSKGADRGEVARVLNMRYGNQEPFLAAARRADLNSLTGAIARLAKTDLAIKTSMGGSKAGARMQLEMLVCELSLL